MKRESISKLSENIQKLLKQELECYQCLIELSKQQRSSIIAGDVNALMGVLAQKEDLISKISQLESAIQHIFRRSPKLLKQMPESVNRLINAITTILKQITVLEKESGALFIEKYNEIKKELGNLKQTKIILKAYAPQKAYRPRFIDKKT